MVEIFTVGGGDYLVNVFQAVAAWTGNGGYKSLIQVVMVMGLGAFRADARVQPGLARVDQLVPWRDADLLVPDGAAARRPCDRPAQSRASPPPTSATCRWASR